MSHYHRDRRPPPPYSSTLLDVVVSSPLDDSEDLRIQPWPAGS